MANVIELFEARELTAEEIVEAHTTGELLRMGADAIDELAELERIARLAYSDPHQALHDLCARPYGENTSYLETAIVALIHVHLGSGPREQDIREKFYGQLGQYVPGATRISKISHPKHQPDGFVAWQGLEVPVEIKRRAFDAKALAQLQRYMKVYDSEKGIAVAPELTCVLPGNIHFVQVAITNHRRETPAQSA